MPAKLIPREYIRRGNFFYRPYNTPESSNNSAALLQLPNNSNFVEFFYVFENRRLLFNPPPAAENHFRLEFRHQYLENANGPNIHRTVKSSDISSSNTKKSSSKRSDQMNLERTIERSSRSSYCELMNKQLMQKELNEISNPKFLNFKNYKPVCGFHLSKLYNGSRFSGHQKSKSNSYEVEVIIQHFDPENSYICGSLKINGLTEQLPIMNTFFEGQIISKKYPFLTRKFDATSEVDEIHWSRLMPGIQRDSKEFAEFFKDDFDYSQMNNSECIFMRWKEKHLIKNCKLKEMRGCSFDGFYYIAYNKRTYSIDGLYYHQQSEDFQTLTLKHDSNTLLHNFEIR